MRKKLVVRMLCLAMAASMIGRMVPPSQYPVVGEPPTPPHQPQGRKLAQQKLFLKMVSGTNGHRTISWDLILYAKWKMDGCI